MGILQAALARQYARTMREAYAFARSAAVAGGAPRNVLDCGSGRGQERMATFGAFADGEGFHYCGLEWNAAEAAEGRAIGLDIVEADLNRPLPVEADSQDCIIALSVVEHLLMPCAFIRECHRALRPGGRLVLLTPNISTYFTVLQVLAGQMPSSGPHPDSNELLLLEQPANVSERQRDDVSADTPMHRHLVVFSLKVLERFLTLVGFSVEHARGFGYYPLPTWIQPFFERVDKAHCHQMVLVCRK
ncbi:class I SAM-dependent methyltransferase [Luteimonas vadosa]|uniref:Class I SAM-dependent methyltransferase n=1 Tax=Luteimonas vadosa TaxID=1165507 RepID=A0ABP9DS31_9GAMM